MKRSDGIKRGVLVELPESLCKEAGWTIPVAISSRIQKKIDNLNRRHGGEAEPMHWDILFMSATYLRGTRGSSYVRHDFPLILGDREIKLHAVLTYESALPYLTIVLPQEDAPEQERIDQLQSRPS